MTEIKKERVTGMMPGDLQNPANFVEKPGEVSGVSRVKPLYDRIVVRRVAAESRTKGGIIIPETAKEKPIEGIVVAVGQGRYIQGSPDLKPLVIKEGDHVLFSKVAGTEVIINEVEHLILREDEILSVVVRLKSDPILDLMNKVARMTDREAEAALKAISELLEAIPERKDHNLPA